MCVTCTSRIPLWPGENKKAKEETRQRRMQYVRDSVTYLLQVEVA